MKKISFIILLTIFSQLLYSQATIDFLEPISPYNPLPMEFDPQTSLTNYYVVAFHNDNSNIDQPTDNQFIINASGLPFSSNTEVSLKIIHIPVFGTRTVIHDQTYTTFWTVLKISHINISVDKVLDIAKTITTIKINLPMNGNTMIKTTTGTPKDAGSSFIR